MTAYTGKILWVDLTTKQCKEEQMPEEIYYNFLSGIGLAARILYERIPAGADPLGPENILAFVSGLLTGTGSLFTGRWTAAAKSPLTGTWGEANCGGNFSPAIKKCGYDGIFFSGTAKTPVYLQIDHNGPEILPADDLWGKDAIITEEILISRSSKKKPAVACIGTAGEKLSLLAGICNDQGRIAARSGLGAVMGAKRLKAIVLEGSLPILPANGPEMKRLSKKCKKKSAGLPMPGGNALYLAGKLMAKMKFLPPMPGKLFAGMFKKWGTSSLNQFSVEWGDSPIKNWKGTSRDYPKSLSKTINADRLQERVKKRYHCYSCPLGCGGMCKINVNGEEKDTHKPEYETVMSFGGMLLQNDLESIFYINDLLNRAGMDTISAGGAVAFAFECFEEGIITSTGTGGLQLTWGNTEAVVQLVEMMVRREGIGDILADGVKAAARKIGKTSEAFSMAAGGQELPMHDPRNDPGYGLHYSVEPAPGRHTLGCQQYYGLYRLWKRVKGLPKARPLISVKSMYVADREKAICAVANSCFSQFYNGAGLCVFGALIGADRVPVFEWMNAAAGWNRKPEEYMEIGKRVQTLKQLFNIKQGIEPRLLKAHPRSVGEPPQQTGPNRGRSFDLDKMMADYWREIGWDPESGVPLPETIEELGLADLNPPPIF